MARKGVPPCAEASAEDETIDMNIYGTVCGEDFTGNTLKYAQTGTPDKIKSQAIVPDHNVAASAKKIYCLVKDSAHAVPYIIQS
jgi:hypothetical protein